MRRRSRWLTAGAAVGALALALSACGSGSGGAGSTGAGSTGSGSTGGGSTGTSGGGSTGTSGGGSAKVAGLYGSLPAVGSAKSGGTITVGDIKGQTPNYAMPIVPSADSSVFTSFQFVNLMNQPLYWSPEGATVKIDQADSLANLPTYSNGNKTVKITLKNWKWSNGTPVTGENVVEYIDILKAALKESAANFGNYSPGYFPDNVKSASASGQTVTLNLTKAYNPNYYTDDQLDLLYAFPPQWAITKTGGKTVDFTNPANAKAIYNFLNKQASDMSTFGSNPLWKIADGPMECSQFNPTLGSYTMVPNPKYSGPQAVRFKELKVDVYTSTQTMFNNLRSGNVDIASVDATDLPSIGQIKNQYSVFGLPDFGFQATFINFKNKVGDFNNVIKQLYIRQALAHLVDQPGIVKGLLKGAGAPDYGPVPSSPPSPYAPSNATNAPYPYSTSAAASLLKSHGWKVVPNGQTTCQDPSKCAPDGSIPKGTKLSFSWDYGNSPPLLQQQSTAIASAAKAVGIKFKLKSETFNQLIANDNDPSAPSKEQDWQFVDFGGFTNSLYPTTNTLFNTGGTYNLGEYNSPKANTLIHNSVFGASSSAVSKEASYLTSNVPVLFTPNPDYIWAVKKGVSGTNNGILGLTQYTWTPQYWYLTK